MTSDIIGVVSWRVFSLPTLLLQRKHISTLVAASSNSAWCVIADDENNRRAGGTRALALRGNNDDRGVVKQSSASGNKPQRGCANGRMRRGDRAASTMVRRLCRMVALFCRRWCGGTFYQVSNRRLIGDVFSRRHAAGTLLSAGHWLPLA